jgi:hypothetical protein
VTDRIWPLLLLAVVVVLALLYRPALDVGYISDDFDVLVVTALPWAAALDPFPAGTGFYFRPLPLLSHRLEAVFGGGPVLAHAVNVALHGLCTLWVALIARRLGAGSALAAVLALWFGVHAANSTPVYWISARGDLLATLFVLLAIHTAVRWRLEGGVLRLAACSMCVAAALMSKEAAAAAPVALLALAATVGDSRARGGMPGLLVAVVPVWLAWLAWAGWRAASAVGDATGLLAPAPQAVRDFAQAA